jgi:hypothetical protein
MNNKATIQEKTYLTDRIRAEFISLRSDLHTALQEMKSGFFKDAIKAIGADKAQAALERLNKESVALKKKQALAMKDLHERVADAEEVFRLKCGTQRVPNHEEAVGEYHSYTSIIDRASKLGKAINKLKNATKEQKVLDKMPAAEHALNDAVMVSGCSTDLAEILSVKLPETLKSLR